jgi:hypothetical protein
MSYDGSKMMRAFLCGRYKHGMSEPHSRANTLGAGPQGVQGRPWLTYPKRQLSAPLHLQAFPHQQGSSRQCSLHTGKQSVLSTELHS